MAIIVEEEKKRSNLLGIAGWVVFLGIALASIYYIFFTAPALVPIEASGSLSIIAPIVTANIDPQSVVNGTQFKSLQSTITVPTPQSPNSVGRSDPFIAP
jgi:hypothetical protein